MSFTLLQLSAGAARGAAPRRAAPHRTPRCSRGVGRVAAAAVSSDDLMLEKCTPLGKRVLFVPDEAEEKTAGGILLPSSASQRSGGFITGEVVAVGSDVDSVKAGTKAIVAGYGGAEVDFQGRKAKFVLDGDILAILS